MCRIVFRTDASQTIGTGHVMRCLTLAEALHKKGVDIVFICREHEGHLCTMIEDRGFQVCHLPSPDPRFIADDMPAHAAWLGVSWQKDAEQTLEIINSLVTKPEWLVVDHYAIDRRWQEVLRPMVGRILVIDDLADRFHDCDILLDQNLVADMDTRYNGKVKEGCSILLGPEYALLQPVYAAMHDKISPREGQIRRILISFGGTDTGNLTGRTLAAFISLNRPDIDVDVVLPNGNPHAPRIREEISGYRNIHLHDILPTLAPLMAEADLAIGAAGTTSWERLCLGLPAIVVSLAENQRPVAEGLQQDGLVWWIGNKDEATEDVIRQAVGKLLKDGLDKAWSSRCRRTVDGKGVDRVRAILITTKRTPLQIRHARISDEKLILSWANDPETRRQSFSQDYISEEEHRDWFRGRLRNMDTCRFYIVETSDGIPIGQVRFEKHEKSWEINYLLSPHFRGRGLGRPLLETAMHELRSGHPDVMVVGKVKKDNLPSQKVFESLGFKAESLNEGTVTYKRLL